MANSVAVFRELSWLTRRMDKAKLDRKAAGLRLGHLSRLRTAIGLLQALKTFNLTNGIDLEASLTFVNGKSRGKVYCT